MSNKKYKDTYVSELYNVEETIDILKKCPADIYFKLYHKIRKELDSTGGDIVKNRMTLEKLAEEMRAGFKQVNNRLDEHDRRFDRLESRIDRIEKRLDYNGLQIVEINKRLDYNGLKPLPKESR